MNHADARLTVARPPRRVGPEVVLPALLPADGTRPAPPANPRRSTLVAQLQRSPLWRHYQRAFETSTGLPLVLRVAGSFLPPLQGSRRRNAFCGLLAQRNQSCAACLQVQQRAEEMATHEPHTLECFAGLSESAVPVRLGRRLVGFLQTGQVFLRPPDEARFAAVVRSWGGPHSPAALAELRTAYFATRVLPKSLYRAHLALLASFAQHLAAASNAILVGARGGELPAMTRVRAFITTHQSEVLSLAQVARAACMTKCYFCRIFKHATGLTFTHYLARLRVEAVRQRLLDPHARVSESAFAAGFQSLSQFNRVFLRITGQSPSEFRDRLHTPSFARRRLPRRSSSVGDDGARSRGAPGPVGQHPILLPPGFVQAANATTGRTASASAHFTTALAPAGASRGACP